MILRTVPVALFAAAACAAPAAADLQPLLGGTLKPLKGDDQFVAPVTSPYYNENSMIGTDVRVWYVYQKVNRDALGPDASVTDYAVQVRLALTDSLQLVAYKDGFLDFDGGPGSEGFNDLAAGIKWQFYRDDASRLYAAVGAGYEFRTGESRALQNDSEYRLWASVDKGWGKFHAGATVNYRASTSGENADNGNSDTFSWHLRADYRVSDTFSPVVEMNGYHIVSDSNTGVALNGADVLNLGARSAGPTVSAGLGMEFRCGEYTALRAAYEVPVSGNDSDLYGTRLTFSLVYTF
ncbi:MAG: hypothetical protein K2Q09_03410 [Phycisphaerales bacterium]|nr:hypothetical protein [Phycisphaerales bacterium]